MNNENDIRAHARRLAYSSATIVFGEAGGPVRTIHKKGKRKPIGRYPSFKARRALTWESVHERQLMWICEADPNIVTYVEQPHRVEIKRPGTLGRNLIYFPDLARKYIDGSTEVIEVKKSKDEIELDPEYEEKIGLAQQIYKARGFQFRVLTAEDDIEIEPYLSNASTIQSHRFAKIETIHELRFYEAIDGTENGKLEFRTAVEAVSDSKDRFDPRAFGIVCALIVRRAVSIDLRQPLDAGILARNKSPQSWR